jgi:hypothetical protein
MDAAIEKQKNKPSSMWDTLTMANGYGTGYYGTWSGFQPPAGGKLSGITGPGRVLETIADLYDE